MDEKMTSTYEQILALVDADLVGGTGTMFKYFIAELQSRSGADEDIFTLAPTEGFPLGPSESVLLAVGVGDTDTYRVSIRNLWSGPLLSSLSVWKVDPEGRPTSDTYVLDTYVENGVHKSSLSGSASGSLDARDIEVTAEQFASRLASVLDSLNTFNWQVLTAENFA